MKAKFILISVIVIIVTSCGKYPDGPKFSLRTKKARATGVWVIEKYYYQGVDVTGTLTGTLELTLKKDDTYTLTGMQTSEGTWEVGSDKDDVYMKPSNTSEPQISYRIYRLTNKEFWVRHSLVNGDEEVIHYKKK